VKLYDKILHLLVRTGVLSVALRILARGSRLGSKNHKPGGCVASGRGGRERIGVPGVADKIYLILFVCLTSLHVTPKNKLYPSKIDRHQRRNHCKKDLLSPCTLGTDHVKEVKEVGMCLRGVEWVGIG
jgi:hypothetical protein